MPSLKEQRRALLDRADSIIRNARTEGRVDLTDGETAEVNDLIDQVDKVDVLIEAAKQGAETLAKLGALAPGAHTPLNGTGSVFAPESPAYLGLGREGRRGLAVDLATKMTGGVGLKILVPSGTAVTPIPLSPSTPVALGRPASSLYDVMPVARTDSTFGYLRQTVRTNNAAPVAFPDEKPSSVYTMERVQDRLRVIAHVSEGINRFDLQDAPNLQRFIAEELLYGLGLAIENQILNGDAIGENLRGLFYVSGVQTAGPAADVFTATREAVTKLEEFYGATPGPFWIMSPSDWADIELSTLTGTGEYALTNAGQRVPVDQAARRLWGCPVVTSTAEADGTAWLVSPDAAMLMTDRLGVRVDWSEAVADDFAHNQMRARCEGRFALATWRAMGIVKVDLSLAS